MAGKKKSVEKVEEKQDDKDVVARWYVFRVQAKKEETMIKKLRASFSILEKDGMKGEDYFLDFTIPKYNFVEYKNGKKVEKEVNSYPGYVFMKIKLTDAIILFLRNFFRLNGFGQMLPKAITDEEYNTMINNVKGLSNSDKNIKFNIGDRVKINGGSFATMEGNILYNNKEEQKLVVGVMIFGCETKVDVDYSQVSMITK